MKTNNSLIHDTYTIAMSLGIACKINRKNGTLLKELILTGPKIYDIPTLAYSFSKPKNIKPEHGNDLTECSFFQQG
jgi:hypothetical protein